MSRGTQAEFAKKYGYSRAAVTQFKNSGRLVFNSDGTVNFDESAANIGVTSKNKNAKEFIDQMLGWNDAVIPEPPDWITYNDAINFAHEYSKVQNQELINFLLEIEAWLTFNQSPDVKNTTALRDDIKILVGKYE